MRFLYCFAVNEGREVVLTGSATHDGAPHQSFSRSTRTIEQKFHEKWAIRLFESKDKK
jgi:hypothetical protein